MGILKNLFGAADEEEEYYDIEDNEGYDVSSSAVTEEEANYGSMYSAPVSSFGSSKAINIHGGLNQSKMMNQSKITVMKPTSFKEMMQEAIDSLREGTIIFLNLTKLSRDEATRIVDFMTGAAAMCDGRINRVQSRCFAIAPKNVEWVNIVEDTDED